MLPNNFLFVLMSIARTKALYFKRLRAAVAFLFTYIFPYFTFLLW